MMSINPQENDILIPFSKDHGGTKNFREKIVDIYNVKSSFTEKRQALQTLISYLRIHEGCQFLERNTEDDKWYGVTDDKVLLKAYEYYFFFMVFDHSSVYAHSLCGDDNSIHSQIKNHQNKRHKPCDAFDMNRNPAMYCIGDTKNNIPNNADHFEASHGNVEEVGKITVTTAIEEYVDTDVVFGCGVSTAGKGCYRRLIKENLHLYMTAEDNEKRSIASLLVDTLMKDEKRRFIHSKTNENGGLRYLNRDKAIEKAMQTFKFRIRKERRRRTQENPKNSELDHSLNGRKENEDDEHEHDNGNQSRPTTKILKSYTENDDISIIAMDVSVDNLSPVASICADSDPRPTEETIQQSTENVDHFFDHTAPSSTCSAKNFTRNINPMVVQQNNMTNKMFPLHFACQYSQSGLEIQQLVKEYPMAVKQKDVDGKYPLPIACQFYQPESVIQVLVKEYPLAVQERDSEGYYPLHLACLKKQSDLVIQLLVNEYPMAVQQKTKYGDYPLHLAC
jgi:ankyrin repeat protein